MDPITGLVSLGSTLLGGLFGASGAKRTNDANLQAVRETNEHQMRLAEYQYEKNLEQWHRENDYNAPAAQMQRLANAGLNPHLVYENGNAIMPAGQSPNYDAPNLQSYQQNTSPLNAFGDAIGTAGQQYFDSKLRMELQKQQIINMQYQNSVAEANAKKTQADTVNAMLDQVGKGYHNEQQRQLTERYSEYLENMIHGMSLDNDLTATNIDKSAADIDLIKAQANAQRVMSELNEQQKSLVVAQINKHKAEIAHIAQLIEESKTSAALNLARKFESEVNAEWNKKFGTNAPWYVKLFSNFADNPKAWINQVKGIAQEIGIGLGILPPAPKRKMPYNATPKIGLYNTGHAGGKW